MASQQLVTHGALNHAELATHGLRPEALLDFSSNLNPYGPPAAVRAALAALDPAPYPDRSCLQLRQALAARHRCSEEQVLPGNGSNELIHLLARALLRPGDTALVVAPAFGEYEHASRLAGALVMSWRARPESGFAVDPVAVVERIQRLRPRLTWIGAPNNPSGSTLAPTDLLALAEACAAVGGRLVVDRAYYAMGCESGDFNQLTVDEHPALLQLHSLTKSYALAGLRLGYLLATPELLTQVAGFQPAWSVSSAAQAAGLAALADLQFLPATIPLLWQTSDLLLEGLERLGLPVWRGALPFLLVRAGDATAIRVALLRQGCVVRDCASFGLPEWIRVAPRRPEENQRLLEAWQEIV